jgi:hypothetical protein
MKRLEDMSIGQRIVLTIAIVIILLLVVAMASYLAGRWEVEAAAAPPTKYDTRIAELDREAINNAYRRKVEKLFEIWLADATGQPQRATAGVANARKAYIGAMTAIERREEHQ